MTMCVNIGHGDERVIAAIQEQAAELPYAAPGMTTRVRALASRLVAQVSPRGQLTKVLFTLGGADANENAIKLARGYTGKFKVLSRYRSYHGASAGAMAATGDPRRVAWEPLLMPGVVHFLDPYRYRSTFHRLNPDITEADFTVTAGTGELLCWGANNDGQLGIGDASGTDQPTPRKVALPKPVLAVSAGVAHSCAVVQGGDTFCWGRASSFASGAEYILAPIAVPRLWGATGIAAGGGHTCALLTGGAVRCAGAWNPGGIADTAVASGATLVDAGNDFSCAVVGGQAICWGANDRGELGALDVPLQPATIALPGPVTTIGLGWEHGCAAPTDPATPVHCWGTPLGVTTGVSTPHPIPAVTHPAAAIVGGEAHTCALDGAGAVECWGETADDVVIGGTPASPGAPVKVAVDAPAAAIDAGLNHTCAIDAGGRVVCWGHAARGQLGLGSSVDSATPVAIVSR